MVEISSNYITSNEFFSGIPLVYQPDRNNSNREWSVVDGLMTRCRFVAGLQGATESVDGGLEVLGGEGDCR